MEPVDPGSAHVLGMGEFSLFSLQSCINISIYVYLYMPDIHIDARIGCRWTDLLFVCFFPERWDERAVEPHLGLGCQPSVAAAM